MASVEVCESALAVYQDLLKEFPDASPDAVAASLQFLKVKANLHVRMEALFDEWGLTSGRFSLLMILRHSPSRQLSPSDLAKRAQVSRATMTQFIDSLEASRFITRLDDPSDRRSTLIRLTPKAESILKKVIPLHLQCLTEMTSTLKANEIKELYRLMLKLVRE